jgi:hypothetical protein
MDTAAICKQSESGPRCQSEAAPPPWLTPLDSPLSCTELRLLKQLPYDLWRPEATPIDQKRLGSMKSEPVIFIAT